MPKSTRSSSSSGLFDLLAPLVSLLGLYLFITSFFLAKRSLPHTSTCDEAAELLQTTLHLTPAEIQQLQDKHVLAGCWMERRVDSMVMVVIDALRFDFALHHLPHSVGARIQESNSSRLLQFVADPPTVTMQRLKALTTGGLPTFADISGNMGGASIEEDTWIQQLKSTNPAKRHSTTPSSKIAFVGDDTWLDLFPHSLDEAYPYPSFNTRDLDTVDNGCLHHIPDLLAKLRTKNSTDDAFEVMIVHFLGVDHVGHTYGPHNEHMDAKLKQMDQALTELLEFMDRQHDSCSVAFIFGDHGMTEDGNHGGGSAEEINAALFAHFSPACGIMTAFDGSEAATTSDYAQTAFTSIHQIDLVPTISLLLGLPIPYANLGSLVPALALLDNPSQTVTALALNAAQVWRYFTMYSSTANQLPGMDELEERLKEAVALWKDGLAYPDGDDSTVYLKACSHFKMFLLEALQLGQRVWTRFDTTGMAMGAFVLFVGIVLWCIPLVHGGSEEQMPFQAPPPGQLWELLLTLLFIVFSCGVLTFGNSYILEEEHVCMFMIGVLGFVLSVRLLTSAPPRGVTSFGYAPLIIPVASRLGELFVSGHGQDPSVQAHSAHHPAMFLSSLMALTVSRWYLNHIQFTPSQSHMIVDCISLICLGQSWWEKRQPDPERHGFTGTRCAIAMVLMGLPVAIFQANLHQGRTTIVRTTSPGVGVVIIIKMLLLIMIVTGPSSATSVALFSAQACAIFVISSMNSPSVIPSAVLAALWRFIVRHVFFATNHGCTFSRLQLSAAFVATSTFNFVFAGTSLFINTFGWEMVGLSFAWLLSSSTEKKPQRLSLWRWYCLYQLIETLCSCISVSVLRRHLMVWDIYAPHFLFVAIFMILFSAFQLLVCYFGYRAATSNR